MIEAEKQDISICYFGAALFFQLKNTLQILHTYYKIILISFCKLEKVAGKK